MNASQAKPVIIITRVQAAFPPPPTAGTSPGTSRVHSGIPPVGDATLLAMLASVRTSCEW